LAVRRLHSTCFPCLTPFGSEAGLRVGFFPLAMLGLELEAGAILGETRPDADPARLYAVRSQLVLQLPLRVTPFVAGGVGRGLLRSEEHTSERQSRENPVCRL